MPNNEHHTLALTFVAASGLRISELQALYVRDIVLSLTGTLWIRVAAEDILDERKRAVRQRTVPILASYKQDILAALADRQPDEKVFANLPKRLAGEARLRKQYARALYAELNELLYGGPDEWLELDDYWEPAVYRVADALGEDLGVTTGSYLALYPQPRL